MLLWTRNPCDRARVVLAGGELGADWPTECCRVDPTARLAGGQILAALEEISVVVSRCMGWSVSKLTRDIIREHTAWEAREVALAESRANLERTSGGNAHWRYYARRD